MSTTAAAVEPEASSLPFNQLPGLEPSWSRHVWVTDAAGQRRRWHVLDNGEEAEHGTMLCLHGNPTWSYLWRRFLAAAPPGWRVIAPDHLGMGFSERLAEPRRLADRIDDLHGLTESLGITGRVIVVAHDWGGPIALGWALRHREQVAGLVLTNTGVAIPGSGQAPPLIRLARSKPLRQLVCTATPAFVGGAPALSRPAVPAEVRAALALPYRARDRRRAIADFVADIPVETDHPTRSTLNRIADGLAELRDVPTLLLWGANDPVFSDRYLNDLLGRLPQASVHRFARASHLVTEDAPETTEHVWRWIGELGRDATPSSGGEPQSAGTPFWAALMARADDDAVATVELSAGRRVATSFADLERRIAELAVGLSDAGVRPGDRVALLIRPGLDLTVSVYACWRVGAAIVLADAGLGVRNLGSALRSAAPDHLIAIPAGLAVAASLRVPGRRVVAGSLPAPVRRALKVGHSLTELSDAGAGRTTDHSPTPDAEAAVLFTSGATGPAKGVVYRHRQLRAQLDLVARVMRIGPDDRLVTAFAPFALYGPALGVAAAAPDMDVTRPGTLTAAALADAVIAIDATVIFAAPAALRNVVETAEALTPEQRTALSGVRTVLSAGAPVPIGLLRRFSELLPQAELHTPYGMTEAIPVTDISLAEIEAAGPGNGVCVGRPVPGVRIRVSALDGCGRASGALSEAVDVTGEICVSGPHIKDSYDRLWATQQQSARDPGWHRTGDVGHLDGAGLLWVEGRLGHVIATPDGPLTPVGIEQRVERLPDVRAAAVVGVGPVGTAHVVVIVVPTRPARGPLADAGLTASVRAAAEAPVAAVLTLDALPVDIRHASKVDRARLARWAERVLRGEGAGRP